MNVPNSTVTVRLSFQLVTELNKLVMEKKYRDRSDAITQFIRVGLKLDEIKTKSSDPNFTKYLEEMRQNDSILDWTNSLSTDMLAGVQQVVQYQLDERSRHGDRPLIMKIID